MAMPSDIGVIDLMINIPSGRKKDWYEFLRGGLMDKESLEQFEFPVQYMFKDVPPDIDDADPVGAVLEEMDHFGIEVGLVGVDFGREMTIRALTQHPDRFVAAYEVDPNKGMDGVRDLVKAYETFGIKAASAFPAGLLPQVAINDKKFFPLYAKCIELGLPIFVTAGVPGPRVPMGVQDVALIDEVCWFFPELTFVTRHGCEPWADLAVKLMVKWPNLYYSTSAFAPRYYPSEVIHYANTRGADKVMYAGYFPMGLSLERIFKELPEVALKDEVWPKFLRENALRVLGLGGSA